MARINTNVASLTAQLGLSKSQKSLSSTLQRLSTGLRINSGEDDPAGLIASEGLKSEMAGISQAIDNSNRASNVISTADGALTEVSSLLTNIKSLIVQAANTGGMSADEIQANQLQVDSAVASITRISNTSSFAGLNLLNGSLDYVTSGVAASAINSLSVNSANFGTRSVIPVNIQVVTSAQPANLLFPASAITSSVTLEISGKTGVSDITLTSGTTASGILSAINSISSVTGVQAAFINSAAPTSGVKFISTDYGSSAFVSVTAQKQAGGSSPSFTTTNNAGGLASRTVGVDAVATVNGALSVGSGRDIHVNTVGLDMDFTLNKSVGTGSTSFNITGGGAMFQLGAAVNSNQQVSIGIGSVAATRLGNDEDGYLNSLVTGGKNSLVAGGAEAASNIVDDAINQIAVLRGRLGAFEKNTLDTNVNSLSVTLENVTSAESDIADADFASETSAMTRAQILTQAGTSVLATANSTPQQVLSLLQGH
ncbi:MAG TPA: flagellin [Tepidisphaeraceae bacterium]|jgi:flagellin|nr:flagellin [Tepidisphaeraceae bacterium]